MKGDIDGMIISGGTSVVSSSCPLSYSFFLLCNQAEAANRSLRGYRAPFCGPSWILFEVLFFNF